RPAALRTGADSSAPLSQLTYAAAWVAAIPVHERRRVERRQPNAHQNGCIRRKSVMGDDSTNSRQPGHRFVEPTVACQALPAIARATQKPASTCPPAASATAPNRPGVLGQRGW